MSVHPSPSGEARAASGRELPKLVALVLLPLVVRLVIGGGVHLTEDEAYYRLWAQTPALGYYDHPPMVAWWIWLGVRIVGDNPLGVRLLPCVSSAVLTLLVVDLGRLAGAGNGDAMRAGLWYNAMLLVAAGGLLAVPDAPAALFWALSLWATFHALATRGTAWWAVAGLAAGLATLSKYSSLFLGPGLFLWLMATPLGRQRLRGPGPWLALFLAAAIFSLNVSWNAGHQWLTFIKQFGRITPHRFEPRYLLEFVATQILLLNPLLFLFLTRLGSGGAAGAMARRRATPFLLTSLPFVLYLAVHSLHDRIQAHWPAPIYPGLAVCAALAASSTRGAMGRLRPLVPWFGFGAVGAAMAYLALPLAQAALIFDPGLPVRGWPTFAGALEAQRERLAAGWIGTTSYGLAAQLMTEPSISAPVLQITERARWASLPSAASAAVSGPGLLVDLPRRIDLAALRRCFEEADAVGYLARGPIVGSATRYEMVRVNRPRGALAEAGCDSAFGKR